MDVAFLCTGNICRSPMAEVLLRARLATVAPEVVVSSAGELFDGRPAERDAIKAMDRRGIDLSTHTSQIWSSALLADASVVIGMERRHIRDVAVADPALFRRSATLPELVRLVEATGPRRVGEPLRDWVERATADREATAYLYEDRADEIADPMGGSARTFRACADAIDGLLATLVDLAWTNLDPSDPLVAPTPGGIHADRDRR